MSDINLQDSFERFGKQPRILAGPYRGARFYPDNDQPDWFAMVMGSHQLELHAAIEQAIETDPDLIVILGDASGYHCAGLAHRLPKAHIIASHTSPEARTPQRNALSLNGDGPHQVLALTHHSPNAIMDQLRTAKHPLVLCDSEDEANVLAKVISNPTLDHAHVLLTKKITAEQTEAHRLLPALDQRLQPWPTASLDEGIENPWIDLLTQEACAHEQTQDEDVWLVWTTSTANPRPTPSAPDPVTIHAH